MSSSPKEPIMNNTTPYVNRYSERYKSLLAESPPRDFNTHKTPVSSTLKNSPLQSNREHRIFEGEKYTTLKVKNEDRGEWRENTMFNEENVDEVEQVRVTKPSSPYQTTTATVMEAVAIKSTPPPIQRKSHTPVIEERHRQEQRQHQQEEQRLSQEQQQPTPQPQHHRRSMPHYMQATSSFESRVHSTKERRSQSNLLGPRSKGGISKRVGTAKIPRYQATTTINAIEDIQSEMLPDDVYVPMAARIKLFEKGLGNGSNKPVPVARQSSSTSTNSSQPKPSRSTSTRISPTPTDSSLPSYARGTVASETKERTRKPINQNPRTTNAPAKSIIKSSERDKSFNEKLNLWKGKDKIATMESNQNRGIKRKNEHPTSTRPYKK